jgi:hypothetical protein
VTVTIKESEGLDARRRSRGPGCASNLTLDRYLVGELAQREQQALATHLAGCPTCADVYGALERDARRFPEEMIPALAEAALARAASHPRSSWLAWLRKLAIPSLALGTAGAAALAISLGHPAGDTRTKGPFFLSPYVLHPEQAVAIGHIHQGEPLHPGDRLQFRYNGERGGYLALVSVDADGAVSAYYPPGPTAAPVEPGRDVALQSAIELDGSLGREVILAVRCDQPLAVAKVMQAARQAADAARTRGGAPTDLGPLGLSCDETRQVISKTAAPAR